MTTTRETVLLAQSTEELKIGCYIIQTYLHSHGSYEVDLIKEEGYERHCVMSSQGFLNRNDAIIYAKGYLAALRHTNNF